MRIFFHLRNGSEAILDHEGVEATSVNDARAQAHLAIQQMHREDGASACDWREWRLAAADQDGKPLFALALSSTTLAD